MAAAIVKFKLEGGRELIDKLKRLDRKMRRSITNKAMRAGAKIMVKAIRAAVPVRTTGPMEGRGAAKKSIGVKIKTYRNSGVTVAIVGERITEGSRVHLHLREYGTVERFWTKQTAAVFGNRAVRDAMLLFRVQKIGWKNISEQTEKAAKKVKLASRLMASLIVSNVRRTGQPTGRVTPKPFFQKAAVAVFPAVLAAQRAVLERELAAVGSV